mmetsp:Transcript_17614/g.21936  ORF Transcript_17614/g.21936 Transcript_17614/m.21936 type:complete len:178 (-) Transcript_17614:39-572(-)
MKKNSTLLLIIASLILTLPFHATANSESDKSYNGVQYGDTTDGDYTDDYNDEYNYLGNYDEEEVEIDYSDDYRIEDDEYLEYNDDEDANYSFMKEGEYNEYDNIADDDGDFMDDNYEESDDEGYYDDYDEETEETMCETQMDMDSCQMTSQLQNAGLKCKWDGQLCVTRFEEMMGDY